MTVNVEISGPSWDLASDYRGLEDPQLQSDLQDLEQSDYWQNTVDSFTPRINAFETLLDELGVKAN